MAEANEVLGSVKSNDKVDAAKDFIKKFSKLDNKKAVQLKEGLEKLEILKLKPGDISKIIDILPENATELNKIFTEVSLDAEETNKILDTIKQNK